MRAGSSDRRKLFGLDVLRLGFKSGEIKQLRGCFSWQCETTAGRPLFIFVLKTQLYGISKFSANLTLTDTQTNPSDLPFAIFPCEEHNDAICVFPTLKTHGAKMFLV